MLLAKTLQSLGKRAIPQIGAAADNKARGLTARVGVNDPDLAELHHQFPRRSGPGSWLIFVKMSTGGILWIQYAIVNLIAPRRRSFERNPRLVTCRSRASRILAGIGSFRFDDAGSRGHDRVRHLYCTGRDGAEYR